VGAFAHPPTIPTGRFFMSRCRAEIHSGENTAIFRRANTNKPQQVIALSLALRAAGAALPATASLSDQA